MEEAERNVLERCVRCGAETEYLITTPISVRLHFIEGSGQLCESCWNNVFDTESPISREIVRENEQKG